MRLKVVLFAVLALVASVSYADTLKQVTRTLASNYKAMDAAYRKKDISTLEKMFDDKCKFKMKGEGQSLNKPLFVSGTKTLFKMRDVTSQTKLVSVTKTKDGSYLATSHWSGQTAKSKTSKSTKGTDQILYDTWKKTKNGWVIVNRLIEQ